VSQVVRLIAFLLLSAITTAEELAQIELTTLTGESIRPADAGTGPFAVLVFVTSDCPIANAFQPELGRLALRARELGGRLTMVHVIPTLSVEEARSHAAEFGITAPVVIDRTHRLVKATGAEMTPEAAVIDREGRVVYRGRINNLFVTYGKRRAEATENDLRDAMEAVASEKPVPQARTEALGCYIPSLP
jgi:hypothetical protein